MSVWKRLAEQGIDPPVGAAERFDEQLLDAFLEFLQRFDEEGGFFSARDGERILERHVFESLVFVNALVEQLPRSLWPRVADVGSGPGLPGFLFACLHDPPDVTLIDSSRRRLGLLERELGGRGPRPVHFCYERVEELGAGPAERFELVVARALFPYPFSLELLAPVVADGGYVAIATAAPPVAPPGAPSVEDLGFVRVADAPHPELAFLGERHTCLMQKQGRPRRGYPRPWPELRDAARSQRAD